MLTLILGLLLFLGAHSVRIVADDWRSRQIARMGPLKWKGLYALVSLLGLILIVVGYGTARQHPVVVWVPPAGMAYLAALLTLPAFILLTAAEVPRNAIKARLHHPMVLGVKLWAFAHLLANGTLAGLILFGAFLLWAIVDFRSAQRRQPAPKKAIAQTTKGTVLAVVIGVVVWAVFALFLHEWLIGVAPIAR
jgi:uncharacterized membrane protein